jgi:hypothetical protein
MCRHRLAWIAAMVATTLVAQTANAQKSQPSAKGKSLIEVDWGAGLQVIRFRGQRKELCRPEPCIVLRPELVPVAPSGWMYLSHAGLKRSDGTSVLELVFLSGLSFRDEVRNLRDVHIGIGFGLLSRKLVLGTSVDLWRTVEEPGGPADLASGLLMGVGPGPGGFRWRENLGFFLGIDLVTLLGNGPGSGTGSGGEKKETTP